MLKIAYVNGAYVPHSRASVHIEDRGYQFADGVYEVAEIVEGKLIDWQKHEARLKRSLEALRITPPVSWRALPLIVREVMRRNAQHEGIIYLQITRGAAPRNHPFPKAAKPALVITSSGPKTPKPAEYEKGVSVITLPEIRWARRDIKSISLLPNILAKQQAAEAGAKEAWFVTEDGAVTEGSSTNAYIVTHKGEIITHPATEAILGGVTRDTALALARAAQIKITERPFTLKEALGAAEAFFTSSTARVLPVVAIDGQKIGGGKPGPVTRRLMELYGEKIGES